MTKQIRVLHFSTHDEDCGIGKYQEQFLKAMEGAEEIENEFFSFSPNQTKRMTSDEFTAVLKKMRKQMKAFDILHIQHEVSFYWHDELDRVVSMIRSMGKKVAITVHTAPDAQYKTPIRTGLGPRSFINYLRMAKIAKNFTNVHLKPIRKANLVLVHNTKTKQSLIQHGIQEQNIAVIQMPVPNLDFEAQSHDIRDALQYRDGDIVLAAVGFLSKYKGIDQAVKALSILPPQYKLAIIGGIHPNGGNESYLDKMCDLVIKYGLAERVYITGYVDDDEVLNALIRECTLCVYPYDLKYYAYASSAALNNALANHKPVIAYPTASFKEINKENTIAITKSANYYELARSVKTIDLDKYSEASQKYAEKYSYAKEAINLIGIYRRLEGKENTLFTGL